MLRRTILSTLALLSLTSTAFGGVIWSSAGYMSGHYDGGVHQGEWNSDWQIVNESDLKFSGPCGASLSGATWDIQFGCGSSDTGGGTFISIESPRDLSISYGGLSGETELTVFGALLVPGTGSTAIQLDMLYDWSVGGASSGWGRGSTPTLTLGGIHVPIAVDVIMAGGAPEHDFGFFSGQAIATIQRGTPILFSIKYDSEFSASFGHPSPSITTDFNLEGIKEVQVASAVPEPASIAITAIGLLALAAWTSRRRRDDESRSV